MQVIHEPPRKDLSFFVRAPLRLISADGHEIELEEWCLAGVKKPDTIEVFPVRGTLQIPFQGVDLRFPVKLAADATGDFFAFEDLTVRQRETLALFYNNILSGRMAATEDVITALDTPVDLVPMSETEEEKTAASAQATSRNWRIFKAVVTYLVAAFVIFGLVGKSVTNRAFTIPAFQARVVAPMVDHVATAPAYIDKVLVDIGAVVSQGETLVRMTDPRREGRLEDARRALKSKLDALSTARKLLRKHEATYPRVLKQLEAKLDLALVNQSQSAPDVAETEVQNALAAVQALEENRSLVTGDYHDIRRDLVAQRDQLKEAVRQEKRAVGIAKADARLLDIKARVDGTVRGVVAFKDSHVSRGSSLVMVEENAARIIRAWVDESHLTRVTQGMTAQVQMPSLEGRITTQGIVQDVVAGIDESAAKRGFGLIVTVSVASDTPLVADMPVGLRVWRGWVPEWARF